MLPAIIESERLILRAARESDALALNAAVRESIDNLRLWMPWAQSSPTLEESQAYAREAERHFASGTKYDFNILLRDAGEDNFVGRIGIWPLAQVGDWEIGYWCRSSQQNRGFVSEAVRALCESARKYLQPAQPRRLIIRCDARNVASGRVAVRCGFGLHETQQGMGFAPDGKPRDTQIFVLALA